MNTRGKEVGRGSDIEPLTAGAREQLILSTIDILAAECDVTIGSVDQRAAVRRDPTQLIPYLHQFITSCFICLICPLFDHFKCLVARSSSN